MEPGTLACVVTGMHRSGTTWLGHALGAMSSIHLLDEPFHPVFGLRGVRDWYLDPNVAADRDLLERGTRQLLEGTARFRRKFRPLHPVSTASVLLRGSATARAHCAFRKERSRSLAIKDPFLLRMVPDLLARGERVIVSLRHPAAILGSLDRMGWSVAQTGASDRIEAMARWWQDLHAPLVTHLQNGGGGRLFIAPHETMFDDVTLLADALLDFLGAPEADRLALRAFMTQSTQAGVVVPGHARQHDLARNSQVLATSWRAACDPGILSRFESLVGADYRLLADAGARSLRSADPATGGASTSPAHI